MGFPINAMVPFRVRQFDDSSPGGRRASLFPCRPDKLVTYNMSRLSALQRTTDLRPVRSFPFQLTAMLLAGLLIMPPVSLVANNRKGDKLWNEARAEEAKGNLDHAL